MSDSSGLGRGFSLWDGPAPAFLQGNHSQEATIEERFMAFHEANPWVYDTFVALARDLVSKGRTTVGAKSLFEVIRWNWDLHSLDTDDPYRLNNDYTSRYARLAAEQETDLAGLFRFRQLRAA